MAQLVWYVGSTATMYWFGKNLLSRGANMAIDSLLNTNANPEIKELKTLTSIKSMLNSYKNLENTHPAKECYDELNIVILQIEDLMNRAKIRLNVHQSGYVTRWRTFDATPDNVQIENKIKELQEKLDLFTKLIKMPNVAMLTLRSVTKYDELL